jgi:hypothetical protein
MWDLEKTAQAVTPFADFKTPVWRCFTTTSPWEKPPKFFVPTVDKGLRGCLGHYKIFIKGHQPRRQPKKSMLSS